LIINGVVSSVKILRFKVPCERKRSTQSDGSLTHNSLLVREITIDNSRNGLFEVVSTRKLCTIANNVLVTTLEITYEIFQMLNMKNSRYVAQI
jgi:hypothetical protein